MDEILVKLEKITAELASIKRKLDESDISRNFGNWVPRKKLMEFLDYGDTQMAEIFKSCDLVISEIGNRKFVKRESIIRLLEKNIRQ